MKNHVFSLMHSPPPFPISNRHPHLGHRHQSSTGSASAPHLRLDVCIVVVLEQQCGRLCVVFTGCDVQRWEADLPLCVVLQQQRDH